MYNGAMRTVFALLFILLPLSTSSAISNPKQVFIPAGKALLGSDAKEKTFAYKIGGDYAKRGRWFDTEIKRKVFVGAFSIDKYPVTQSDYYRFVKDTKQKEPHISRSEYQEQGFLVHPYSEVIPFLWKNGKPPRRLSNHPVVLVSVDDAEKYCKWRGRNIKNKNFRLPTEEEWEKASRGSNGRYFPWGNEWDDLKANTSSSGASSTTPVTKYPKSQSPYGVYEMAGNIFEWTGTKAKSNPNRNVLKSCSWDDLPGFCRGSARHSRSRYSRHILIGFRCVSTTQ